MRLQIWYNREKDEKFTYRQHATKLFSILRLLLFSVINTFKEVMVYVNFDEMPGAAKCNLPRRNWGLKLI